MLNIYGGATSKWDGCDFRELAWSKFKELKAEQLGKEKLTENKLFMTDETTPKTAEEFIASYAIENGSDSSLEDAIKFLQTDKEAKILIRGIKEYARQVAQQVRQECADEATVFLPSHPHLHGTKNIDKDSILSIDIEKYLV